MFYIEDDFHCEGIGKFDTKASAIAELNRLAVLPWGVEPNDAPCQSHETCMRNYHLAEFDDTILPWKKIRDIATLRIDSQKPERNLVLL